MKKLTYTLLITASVLFATSCDVEKLMDKEEMDPNAPEEVFKDKTKIREALTHLYGSMWFSDGSGGFSVFGPQVALFECATDHAIGLGGISGSSSRVFTHSTLTASANPFNGSYGAKNPWVFYYQGIRSANVFMAYIDTSVATDEEKELMREEARLLRAIYYHELFRFYGAAVLVGNRIVDSLTGDMERASLEETVDYIVSEFDAVIGNGILPQRAWNEANDYGRVTLGMAYAYKARTLLYFASPLNTPDRNSDVAYQRWAAAAQACKDLINKDWYRLHTDGSNPGLSFARYFNARSSDEQILSRLRGMTGDLYRCLPSGSPWNNVVTWPGTAVSMNAVDAFAMKNGKQPIWGYNDDGTPVINPEAGYDDAKPFENRDPRLDMTVMRHGSTWTVNRTLVTMDINIHLANNDLGLTNVCMRKFLDDKIDHWSGGTTHQNWPMMRYAEVLLNYAEAKNESLSSLSASNMKDIVDNLNLVRVRAGADPLPLTGWTKETLRDQIKLERRMELMLEGHRFYDVRRWLEADKYFNGDVYGMDVVNEQVVRRKASSMIFLEKMYRLPVPDRDVTGSQGKIWQNPNW